MPKIDITQIEGYEQMTADEKVLALEAFEYADKQTEVAQLETDVERLKSSLSKANSEAADWRRKHNALLTEDERREQEESERVAELEAELAEIKAAQVLANHKSKFLTLGYDEQLAEATAQALIDGDTDTVFENQKLFLSTHRSQIESEILNETPLPNGGKSTTGMTLEQLRALGQQERLEWANQNPEQYRQLYGGQ